MKQEEDTGGKQDKRKEATEEYLAGDAAQGFYRAGATRGIATK